MTRLLTKILRLHLACALLAAPAFAQREQIFVGTRPLGLGEAFVAIADDGNAAYWNPAGLPYLQRHEVNLMHSKLYGLGITHNYFAYTRPFLKHSAVGVDVLHLGFEDDELDFNRNHFAFSAGFAFNKNFSLGANVKYLSTNAKLDGASEGEAYGSGFDVGALLSLPMKNGRELRAGVMIHDVAGTRVRYEDTGKRDEILPQNVRMGLAYQAFESTGKGLFSLHHPLVALDVDDRLHLGAEIWLFDKVRFFEKVEALDKLGLRSGVQKDLHTEEGLTWSAGMSVQKDIFRLDYAYTMPPTLPASHRFSLAFSFNFNPHLIEISKPAFEPIFSSQLRRYDNPKVKIGSVWLNNKSQDSLRARITFKAGELTNGTWSTSVRVDTDRAVSVDLIADFSQNILNETETQTSRRGEVKAVYRYRGKPYTETLPVRFFLHGDGAMLWDQPGRAAAFITQADSLVRAFAISLTGAEESASSEALPTRELADAIAIFEGLRAYGVAAKPDPNATFAAATTGGSYIDTILWPDAVLSLPQERRAGDCDDLAILYSALLESVGIQTALLKTTGHLFMMFNTGIPETHRFSLPVPEDLFVKAKSVLWLPIETTALPATFTQAWQKGAAGYRADRDLKDLKTYFTAEEQKIYPPLDHAPIQRTWRAFPSTKEVNTLVQANCEEIKTWQKDYLQDKYVAILQKHPDNVLARNQLGCLYAGLANFEQAEAELDSVLKYEASYAPALNNLGNLAFMKEDTAAARSYYERSLQSQKFKGTCLNLALLYQVMALAQSSSEEHERLLNKSYELLEEAYNFFDGDSIAALDAIGGSASEYPTTVGKPDKKQKRWWDYLTIKEAKRLINLAFAAINERKLKSSRPKLRPAGPTGSEPNEARQFMLYWNFNGV